MDPKKEAYKSVLRELIEAMHEKMRAAGVAPSEEAEPSVPSGRGEHTEPPVPVEHDETSAEDGECAKPDCAVCGDGSAMEAAPPKKAMTITLAAIRAGQGSSGTAQKQEAMPSVVEAALQRGSTRRRK